MSASRRATLLVCGAYTWWGCSAIFWRELASVAPIDQLMIRTALACVSLSLVWLFWRTNPLRGLSRRHVLYGAGSALAIALNWGIFLWAIDNGQAVEAALGYFLMPLISVALGVGLLGEQLRRLQGIAILLASIGLVWNLVVVGRVPLVALGLGCSFALYGLARKQGPWNAVDGLTFETALLSPVAIGALLWRLDQGTSITGDGTGRTVLLLACTGIITAIPLLLFAAAAKQVPLSTVGLLQYINPVLQFLVGWQVLGESVSTARLLGFAWVLAALVLVIGDELRSKGPVDLGQAGFAQRRIRLREGLAAEEAAVRRQR